MTPPLLLPVQYLSTPGYQLPANTIDVSHPSKWANPFRKGKIFRDMAILSTLALTHFEFKQWAVRGGYTPKTEYDALLMYRRYVTINPYLDLNELRGFNLACTCHTGKQCHRDLLLQLANE